MFRTTLAINLGSVNTRCALRTNNIGAAINDTAIEKSGEASIFCEKTCISTDCSIDQHPAAIGNESNNLIMHAANSRRSYSVGGIGDTAFQHNGANLIFPVREGSVANTRLLSIYLKRLACKLSGKRSPTRIDPHIAVSRAIGDMKLNQIERTIRLAGFRSLQFHDAQLMGAIGAGIDVFDDRVAMLVDIGAETICCAAIANGGIVWESMNIGGCASINRAIINFFAINKGVLIGESVAELIKCDLERERFIIDGRSCSDGFPKTVHASSTELMTVVKASLMPMLHAVSDAIKALQPDAVSDLIDSGITIIGGGARIHGIEKFFSARLGIPVKIADNAETAVISGLSHCLFTNKSLLTELKRGYMVSDSELQLYNA